MSSSNYASEGFDLDAIPSSKNNNNASNNDDVIYEIGGSATAAESNDKTDEQDVKASEEKLQQEKEQEEGGPMFKSEECKRMGNDFFKQGDFLNAYDMYSDAIDACPGMTGAEIMKLKEDYEMKEREKANQRYLRDTDRRRKPQSVDTNHSSEGDAQTAAKVGGSDKDEGGDDELAPCEFQIPPHEYGIYLATYYCNRAACLLHESRYDNAIQDCDLAILLNPKYTKAYIRRMTAYEKTEQTEEALRDAKQALGLDPQNKDIRKHVSRLQKMEDERMEKLKEETMGKLKDLGNSILGNFGLSLDNFKTQKDPNTGSYSISFQQN